MIRPRPRGMTSTRTPGAAALLALALAASCRAGPLGGLQNVTSVDVGVIEGSCAVGDVVYMPGDEFPGSGPCERCACARAGGGVTCARLRCDPRPGCKALHRPDHCCPTYQCECEQEGHVYGNGEKLVDPADPCRVCYCQGGEVVCRRIACFVRDDCQPRLVPGRCCPDYDNCPLRGVTTAPGAAPSTSIAVPPEDLGTSSIPSNQKENIKQEITIKEITPVSEIPVITDFKIKEILPSHGIDVAEYSSPKAPLSPREATTERTNSKYYTPKIDTPLVIEITSSSTVTPNLSSFPSPKSNLQVEIIKKDLQPSKIGLSTQDNNDGIYTSNVPIVITMGSYSMASERAPMETVTRSPIIEEEEPVEHNPAFPPIPDDLSVSSNHEDEINSEQNLDMHLPGGEDVVVTSTEAPTTKQTFTTPTTTVFDITSTTKGKLPEDFLTTNTVKLDAMINEAKLNAISSPALNLRSAIPTEILNSATGDINIAIETTASTTNGPTTTLNSIKTGQLIETNSELTESRNKIVTLDSNFSGITDFDTSTRETSHTTNIASKQQDQTTSSISKSNAATEITLQTELSSLPIETSDQNPHETIDNLKEKISSPSIQDNLYTDATTVKSAFGETKNDRSIVNAGTKLHDNIETTEFIINSFGSSETATDAVELIKISPETEEKAAIIEPAERHKNVLTDLINLVGDVASISDQTDEPSSQQATITTGIAESEELIPVNAGYKSKNKNYNQNTITESARKNKNPLQVNKQKIVEIEDDDFTITDSPSPNDKIEPTTKRPIIDKVSDDVPENKTTKKDIEIINKTYVSTVDRRPTKVIMKKYHDEPVPDETNTETDSSFVSSQSATELSSLGVNLVTGTSIVPDESSVAIDVTTKAPISTVTP